MESKLDEARKMINEADAAMAELFADTIHTDLDTLCAIGSTIGADIPFCVVGGCAKTLGIGDRITPLDYAPDCTVLLARDGSGISTPQAYRTLDNTYGERLAEDFGDFDGFFVFLHKKPSFPLDKTPKVLYN